MYEEYNNYNKDENQNEGENQFQEYRPERIYENRNRIKRTGGFRRFVGIIAAAILFGGVAGFSMNAVNSIMNYYKIFASGDIAADKPFIEKEIIKEKDASDYTKEALSPVSTTNDVTNIVEKAMPSVVAINATAQYKRQTWFGQSQIYEAESSGSGIIIGDNGEELLIVTNNHVIENTKDLSVIFIDDKEVKATVKGGDAESDIAVIAIKKSDIEADTINKIKIASIGDSEYLKVGQGVVAIGNALGYGQSVTVGYISALDREVKIDELNTMHLLQTDAAINPGNSGGALLDMAGDVIAINSAKYSSTEIEGMGYAIPISKVQDIITELSNKSTRYIVEERRQGYLGIQGQNIDEQIAKAYDMPRGVYVYRILEDSAAAKSELREKDIITKLDGQSIRSMEELKNQLAYYAGGDMITLSVQRLNKSKYEEIKIQVKLKNREDIVDR